ncbi:MAG: McrB family protein [Acutalibacteraceae bacterium]
MIDDVKTYIEIMKSLGVKQMVLQGPPGTSKTYTAKQIIAYGIYDNLKEDDKKNDTLSSDDLKKILNEYQIGKTGSTKCYWDMVQFHPSYGYEDFVRGITIKTSGENIEYKTVNKIFGKMCEAASKSKEQNKEQKKEPEKFFLLIDEINRADIATVFGELIYALEYRGESVEVPYELNKDEKTSKASEPDNPSETSKSDNISKTPEPDNPSETSESDNPSKISVPDNLYIIATMNTADKSVGNIDYAIRRRFLFFDLLPDENVIRKDRGLGEGENDIVINTFRGINKFIEDATKDSQYRANDFKIGHTYFLGCGDFKNLNDSNNSPKFLYKMQYQVLPILREYYIDGIITLENFQKDKTKQPFINYLMGSDISDDEQLKDVINCFLDFKEESK